MRARLFPFSLLKKALQWFYSQPSETVRNWDTLMRAFMKEYYSPGKNQSLRNKIVTFAQYPTETISEAFERFNEYTRAVPHHKFPKEDLVQKFYQGLTMVSSTIIDASAGGSIIELTRTQAFTLFKKVADNDMWASSGRFLQVQPTGNVKGVLQVEKEDILEGKMIRLCGGWRRWRSRRLNVSLRIQLKDFMDEQDKINKDTFTKFKIINKVSENNDSKVTEVGSSNHQVLNMMKMLETRVGQLVGRLSANEGKLPGQPQGLEMAKAIQTGSGKETEDPKHSAGARKPKPSTEVEEFAREEVTEIITE
jgi:hypothetical protein